MNCPSSWALIHSSLGAVGGNRWLTGHRYQSLRPYLLGDLGTLGGGTRIRPDVARPEDATPSTNEYWPIHLAGHTNRQRPGTSLAGNRPQAPGSRFLPFRGILLDPVTPGHR